MPRQFRRSRHGGPLRLAGVRSAVAVCALATALLAVPGPPAASEAAAAAGDAVRFTDVTGEAGIDFVHVHGGGGPNPKRYYIETMGSGAAFFDYDNDGDADLYAVTGQHLTDPSRPEAYNRLYANLGSGTFQCVTEASGAGDAGYGMGVTAGDYDNDGAADLYVTNYGANVLLRNGGDGRFTDVSTAAGVAETGWGVGCSFLDYDNDGDLDLYVANYLEYSLEDADRELRPYLARGAEAGSLMGYPHPDNFPGQADVLYRNEGDGSFVDVTRPAGVYNPRGKGMGMACADYDGDGYTDVFVANDQTENFLFHNQQDGTFTEVGLLAGVAYDRDGRTQSGMGADWGDYDNDGDLDLVMTDYQAESDALYVNEGGGFFTDRAHLAGLAVPSLPYVSWAVIFMDFDNDGRRDVFAANGHVLDNVEQFDASARYAEPNQLFHNQGPNEAGNWRFVDVMPASAAHAGPVAPSRGGAAADYDDDGDMDLFVINSNLPATLLRNDGGSGNQWLQIRLQGRHSNRDGIGARIIVRSGGQTQIDEVRSSCSYLSQNELRRTFGLGSATVAEAVEIRWPSGIVDVLQDVAAGQCITVTEGEAPAD